MLGEDGVQHCTACRTCVSSHLHRMLIACPLAAMRALQTMLADYKTVTDKEKEEVVGLGGLHVVGTERHESRRIDNQLRGRAGRQGDPGSTRCGHSLSVCRCA